MATSTRSSFRLIGADGGPLRGDVRAAGGGEPRPAVVICHGLRGFKDWGFFPPTAERLARAGFTVVSFNFSGSGVGEDGATADEPKRFEQATYDSDLRDLARVLDALREGELGAAAPADYGLLGHSMGGSTCVLHAARDSRVRALATWGAVSRLERLAAGAARAATIPDVLAAASQVRAPWLIVHGERDESVPVTAAREFARAAPGAELLLVKGGSHTFSVGDPWQGPTRAFDLALDVTVDWFTRHLG